MTIGQLIEALQVISTERGLTSNLPVFFDGSMLILIENVYVEEGRVARGLINQEDNPYVYQRVVLR